MKLENYKVGFFGISLILSLVMVAGFAGGVFAGTEHVIDSDDFSDITGIYLSENDLGITDGDTLLLSDDVDHVTQTASLVIDLRNITIKPEDDDATITFNVDFPNWDPLHDWNEDQCPAAVCYSSITILNSGTTLERLKFDPQDGDLDNVLNEGVFDTCYDTEVNMIKAGLLAARGSLEELYFENIEIFPDNYELQMNGFRFDGDLLGIPPSGPINYDGITFSDVRVDGVSGHGIVFGAMDPGEKPNIDYVDLDYDSEEEFEEQLDIINVSNVDFELMYLSNNDKNGLFFNHKGELSNVNFRDSDDDAIPAHDNRLNIERNGRNGIKIKGERVTDVIDFSIDTTKIRDNGQEYNNNNENNENYQGSGIYISTEISNDGDADGADTIFSVGLKITNSVIEGNRDFGIQVGRVDDNDPFDLPHNYAVLDEVVLGNNLTVRNNDLGGAGFFVTGINRQGLIVQGSEFYNDGKDYDQNFGLYASAWEFIEGVELYNSNFEDHGFTDFDDALDFDEYLGFGAAISTMIGTADHVERTVVNNVNATGNEGGGLIVAANNRVRGVDISNDRYDFGSFSRNGQNGIFIYGRSGVEDVRMAGTSDHNIEAEENEGSGLLISSPASVENLGISETTFHDNEEYGAEINAGDTITSEENFSEFVFENVTATSNADHGINLSADEFVLPAGVGLVSDSEVSNNDAGGLNLVATDITNPTIAHSWFINNEEIGINISADEEDGDLKGTDNPDPTIYGNKIAGNYIGIALQADSLSTFSIERNTTVQTVGISPDVKGNDEYDIRLGEDTGKSQHRIASITNSYISNNVLVGEGPPGVASVAIYGKDSGPTVDYNIFRRGEDLPCDQGVRGIALLLDVAGSDVHYNDFAGFGIGGVEDYAAIVVRRDSPQNEINFNNIRSCPGLKAGDYSVDATENYWAKIPADEVILNGTNVTWEPQLDHPVDVGLFSIVDTDVSVGATETTIDYEVKNTSWVIEDEKDFGISLWGLTVWIEALNPDGDVERDLKPYEELDIEEPGETVTSSYTFKPAVPGEYTLTLWVDEGSASTQVTFTVDIDVPIEPDEPDWNQSGIAPAPVRDWTQARLEINQGQMPLDDFTMEVYDLTGTKVATIEGDPSDLTALEGIEGGLYLYTVTVTIDGEEFSSSVRKFVYQREQ